MNLSKPRNICRLCEGADLTPVLSLAPTPAANAFTDDPHEEQPVFPLDLNQCRSCGHVQLGVVVDPAYLFRGYLYSSTDAWHFQSYAEAMMREHLPPADRRSDLRPLVVDVGSNNGDFLRCFKDKGYRVVGVDPAEDIAVRASMGGIKTMPEFFTIPVAQEIRRQWGPAALVTANNVFAHVDDLDGFVEGVKILLDEAGVFVFEVSYLLDVVQKTLFDTIYHEHLSYHAVTPLVGFFHRHGMELFHAERVPPHGGSVRCFARRQTALGQTESVYRAMVEEFAAGLGARDAYDLMKLHIMDLRHRFRSLLDEAKALGPVAGFGAPAKATTLMRQFGVDRDDIAFIIDDNPRKQGRYTPGLHIPIVPTEELYRGRPETVVVFAWNFYSRIIEKHKSIEAKWLVPLPEPRFVCGDH